VNPAIKRELCAAPGEHDWLRKVRPWSGHDDHLHVRLSCVAGNAECQGQAKVPEGDGCDKLAQWFLPKKKKATPVRKKIARAFQEVVAPVRTWPAACDALLEAEPAPKS